MTCPACGGKMSKMTSLCGKAVFGCDLCTVRKVVSYPDDLIPATLDQPGETCAPV